MAASMESEFTAWLKSKLLSLNKDVDLEVFVQYIEGVLDTDTDREDKIESISGLVCEILATDVQCVCESIVDEWDNSQISTQQAAATKKLEQKTAEEQLSSIMEQQKTAVVKSREMTREEKERKNFILKQYGEVSDGEDEKVNDASLSKNSNANAVASAEKEKREKLKLASEQKREKDKLEREKQKQKAQDRKEAEKKRTQKGEKRR